ncbi:MAG: carboxypeptidase regulatory-like domain-containing protein [Terriglobia bacterium]
MIRLRVLALLILSGVFVFSASLVLAQSPSGVLKGQVVDQNGAAISGATVTASSARGRAVTAKTGGNGQFVIQGLAPGSYTVQASSPGFSTYELGNVVISSGSVRRLKVSLQIMQQLQQITVSAQAAHLSLNPSENASALVLKGAALQSLSDDPDEMLAELNALAGPAAGPNGAQIYVDGFTGGQLPPKSDILAIHINQDPFSAQYDRVGYGRIEITTKPGASQYHGSLFVDGNDSAFNSRSPFVSEEPGYYSDFINGNVGGPLGHKASFFFDMFHRNINDSSVVSAVVLNPSFAQVPFSQAVPDPRGRTVISPRVDYQLSTNNLLAVRYQLWRDHEANNGVGQFSLPTQAYSTQGQEQAIELNDTQVVSSRTVNQTGFEYRDETDSQTPASLAPELNVLGAFMGGGTTAGRVAETDHYFELHDMASMSLGKHMLMYGGRVRDVAEAYSSTSDFNGKFTFPTLAAYQLTEQGLQQGLAPAQIFAAGGGPSQFAITLGNPAARANLVQGDLYAEDQWRIRRNLSLSLGLRFETQDHLHDHADFAPRLGLAWGIGASRKTVLRAGFGLFYDRFEEQQLLQAEQLNGANQQQFVVTNPQFYPTVPPESALTTLANAATSPSVYNIDQTLRAPYSIETAVGLERQFSKKLTSSVTYLNSHGVHQFLTRDINAPLPGEFNPANSVQGRPFANVSACSVAPAVPDCEAGFDGNIYQYESDGLYNQNELIANFSLNEGSLLSLFGYYTLNYANSDTSGIKSFASNPYDILADYGRATFDIRDRAVVGGAISLPFGFRLLPFVVADSGAPYNVTVGRDLLGTAIFDQRPAFAPSGAAGPNIVMTSLGAFNVAPAPGEPVIPINLGTGPALFTFNFHLSRTFGFGKEGGHSHGGGGGGDFGRHSHGLGGRGLSGGGRPSFWHHQQENSKYALTLGISVHNAFNIVNLGTPDGNLGSPLFGRSNSLAGGPFSSQGANREVEFQMRFSF